MCTSTQHYFTKLLTQLTPGTTTPSSAIAFCKFCKDGFICERRYGFIGEIHIICFDSLSKLYYCNKGIGPHILRKGKKSTQCTNPRQIVSATVDEDLNDVVRSARPFLLLLRGAGSAAVTAAAAAGGDAESVAPVDPLSPFHRGGGDTVIVVLVLVVRPHPRLEYQFDQVIRF